MKKLISAAEVRSALSSGQKAIYLEPGTIITPAARDLAAELGIRLYSGPSNDHAQSTQAVPQTQETVAEAAISPALIAQIVREVVALMPGITSEPVMIKEEDPSGVRLVKGNTVQCDPFTSGNPAARVGMKEIFSIKESPNMGAGFMTLEESAFSWELKYEEVDYITEGTLDITINGRTYRGTAGDVFYLPRNTTVTFSSPNKARFFFVTYPANWAELSDYQR